MATGDTFGYYVYQSDNTFSYIVKLSSTTATQGGFAAHTGGPITAGLVWPYGARNLRHVTGVGAGGKRARLPIGSAGNALYVSGGTFTIDAGTFTVLGAEGERRPATNIA